MTAYDSTTEKPLRLSVETFRQRLAAGERPIVLDVRGARAWDSSDAKIPGALRAYPEVHPDPNWPDDRLILVY